MRYTKGKWIASNKDTWSVDTTLNKIIYAYIQKLYTCLKASECHGVPMYYMNKQAVIEGSDDGWNADADAADLLRLKDLEELLWVFGTVEPDMRAYHFTINHLNSEPNERGNIPCTFDIQGVEERDRYHQDCLEYEKRKEVGYKLFGEIYSTLYW